MNYRSRSFVLTLTTIVVLTLVIPTFVLADGPSYRVRRGTHAATTGGTGVSGSYVLHGTLGQGSVALSQGITQTASGGIWRGVSAANVLVLEKTYRDDTPPTVEAGDELVFVVAVTNNGYRVQDNVVVTDTLPPSIPLVPGSAETDTGTVSVDVDTIRLTIPTLTYEQIAVLTYRVRVDGEAEGWTITNTATASSDLYGPIEASAIIHVHEPNRIYLPLLTRNYPPLPVGPEAHTLQDAPNSCPGHGVAIGDHLYRDDWDVPNDNDWYSFEAVSGQTYVIQTSELEARADTILTLFDSDCEAELAQNDDVAWPDNVASRIVWTAPTGGTYCVMLRSFDWQVFGNDTGYTFDVAKVPPEPDTDPLPESMPGLPPCLPTGRTGRTGAPVKPPPPPTPEPDSDHSSARPPGKASALSLRLRVERPHQGRLQKPTPPPTPQKPLPAPTPGPAAPLPAPSEGDSQELTPVVLLPETGSSDGWFPLPSLAAWIGGLFLAVGICLYRR